MSAGDELRVEICRDPDNRALRRVYADWLIEQGDPRGEWIALHDHAGDEAELRRRALWQRHGPAWRLADTAGEALGSSGVVRYADGFLDDVSLDAMHLRAMAPMLARQPVRTLSIHAVDDLAAIAALPMLATVERLELGYGLEVSNADALRAVLQAAPRLRSLALTPRGSARFVWQALADHDRIAELEELELKLRVKREHTRWISGALPKLKTLTFRTVLVDAALDGLVTFARFALRRLELCGDQEPVARSGMSSACVAEVLGSPMARGLDELALIEYPAGPEIATALARLPCAARLTSLELGRTGRFAMDGLRDASLPSLTRLNVHRNTLQASDLGALARFPTITTLDISNNALGPDGVPAILDSLPRLERLALNDNRLGEDGVIALGRSERVSQLRHLELRSTSCGSDAVIALIDGGRLAELRSLDLSGNEQIGLPALEALADGPFDKMALLSVGNRASRSRPGLFERAWLPAEGDGQDWGGLERYQRRLALDGSAVPAANPA